MDIVRRRNVRFYYFDCSYYLIEFISKVINQDTSASIDVPPCSHPEIRECVQSDIAVSQDSVTGNASSHHRNSYLFDNIYHLMHLSRAKRDPHLRRRHKHLLFEKHDIHLHPHFFHKLVVVNFLGNQHKSHNLFVGS